MRGVGLRARAPPPPLVSSHPCSATPPFFLPSCFFLPPPSTAIALGACSTTSPDVVSRNEAQRLSTVVDAVVLNSRPVVVEGQQSGIGAAAGSVAGGVAGSGVGGRREAMVVGVIGAVVGGVIGNAVERNRVRRRLKEIVRLSGLKPIQDPGYFAGHDYVLVGRRAALKLPFGRMTDDFAGALRRAHQTSLAGRLAATRDSR